MIKIREDVNKVALLEVSKNNGFKAELNEKDILTLSGDIEGYRVSVEGGSVILLKDDKKYSIEEMNEYISKIEKYLEKLIRLNDYARHLSERI